MLDSIFTTLTPDTLILTPTRRLASTLQTHYTAFQAAQGVSVFETPHILPLNTWIAQCWDNFSLSGQTTQTLLSDPQASGLWETIIRDSTWGEHLLNISSCADTAWQAWQILKTWQQSIADESFSNTEDTRAFLGWAQAYEQRCQEQAWTDTACLPENCLALWAENPATLPKKFILIGFDEITPVYQQCFDTFKKTATVEHISLEKAADLIERVPCLDAEQELKTLAHFAKQQWTENPEKTLGILIPDLSQRWAEIQRVFNNTFLSDNPNALYNFASGLPLKSFPLVHTALSLLSITEPVIDINSLSTLIRSPFIAGAETEHAERAQLDVLLKQLQQPSLSLRHIKAILSKTSLAPLLQEKLTVFFQLPHPKKASASDWVTFFTERLTAVGFPGDRTLSSVEYQALTHFKTLLQQLAQLALLTPRLNFQTAIRSLNKWSQKTLFQPEGDNSAPIQVLGLLEAGGLQFDTLWVTGLDDSQWPAPCSPNPFIPYALQTLHHMPHANADRELSFSQALTRRFGHSAEHVIFSYATQLGEQQLNPSPLIQAYPINETLQMRQSIAPDTLSLENVDDTVGLPLDDSATLGGSSVLKNQAACPFKAYAVHRLQAAAFPTPIQGLPAHTRGSILHDVLHKVWQPLEDQASLLQLSPGALSHCIQTAIDETFLQYPVRAKTSKTFETLEKSRLLDIVHRWLAVEKQRPPFKILLLEAKVPYTIGGIDLTLQVDRLDELADGSRLLIDYKTGNVTTISRENCWQIERPIDPQLPLYVLATENVSAISYAQVRADDMRFKGLSGSETDIPGIQPVPEEFSWAEQLDSWDTNLTHLAKQFACGDAAVDPNDPHLTCQYCDFQRLCRIQSQVTMG